MEAISSSSPQSEIDWDQPRSQNVVKLGPQPPYETTVKYVNVDLCDLF